MPRYDPIKHRLDKERAIKLLSDGHAIGDAAIIMDADQSYIARLTKKWRKANNYQPAKTGKKPMVEVEALIDNKIPNARLPFWAWLGECRVSTRADY